MNVVNIFFEHPAPFLLITKPIFLWLMDYCYVTYYQLLFVKMVLGGGALIY
jgi:hypothetical protein